MYTEQQVVEQKTILFYDDEILAVRVEAGTVFVPIRPMCDQLGLSWSGQRERINRDPVLAEVFAGVRVTRTPGSGGGAQVMQCLPLDYLNGWLFGINASRVKEGIRDSLIRYQRECYQVLARAFIHPSEESGLTPTSAALVQVREMGLAIVRMAEELIALESRTVRVETRLEKAAEVVGQMGRRLTAVEQQVRSGKMTEEQASEIKKRVNLIAQAMTEVEPGKSHFQGVYAALGEETGTTSYKSIPPKGYEAAVEFLDGWYRSLRKRMDEREDGEGA